MGEKKYSHQVWCEYFLLEAPPRIELGIKVLQTSALPLGYGATEQGQALRYQNSLRCSFWSENLLFRKPQTQRTLDTQPKQSPVKRVCFGEEE